MKGTKHDFTTHEDRVRFLDTLAILIGCKETAGRTLPDGCRPDVVRINSEQWILFLGEAKHTETAGCSATQVRMQEYLHWLSIHVNRHGGTGIFALCVERGTDTRKWQETVLTLGHEVELECKVVEAQVFPRNMVVIWFVF